MAAIFALFHIIVVAVPMFFWLLGLFSAGREVLYGASPSFYILVFAVGGTLMYAAVGALVGRGLHTVIRAFRAA
jgi:hypothetical protein